MVTHNIHKVKRKTLNPLKMLFNTGTRYTAHEINSRIRKLADDIKHLEKTYSTKIKVSYEYFEDYFEDGSKVIKTATVESEDGVIYGHIKYNWDSFSDMLEASIDFEGCKKDQEFKDLEKIVLRHAPNSIFIEPCHLGYGGH